MTLYAHHFSTPLGAMLALVDEHKNVVRLDFMDEPPSEAQLVRLAGKGEIIQWDETACAEVSTQVADYFAGTRTTFDLPLAPRGSAFQQSVWTLLQTIPYGSTTTYGDIAQRLGNPAAVRAVGRANGSNPIAVIVPCHRVIGADGTLTGYGGGLGRKARLLELEGAILTLPLSGV